MKWLIVLLVAVAAVVGWRWLERRLQRRLQRRPPPGPLPAEDRSPVAAPAEAPSTPARPTPDRPGDLAASHGFGHGLSTVADGEEDETVDDEPVVDDPSDEDVGSYTLKDWGLRTIRQEPKAEPSPEPPPEPVEEPPTTVEFEGPPTALLNKVRAIVEAGEAPDPTEVEVLAENPLSRADIYKLLKEARKASLIPRKSRTQKAMAEADMVTWLADSRLGRPPQAIEQVDVHTLETREGPMDWYLFRFRSQRRSFVERGWMAGVSGPWIRSEGPGGGARGDTGSDFEPWADLTDQEHAAWVRELMEARSSRA